MNIAIISNTAWYLYNFRLNKMLSIKNENHFLFAISLEQEPYTSEIKKHGIQHIPINISGDGVNPFKEFFLIFEIFKILKKNKIDIVLSNTPKINIYTAIAARLLHIHVVPNISGLGRVFIKKTLLTLIVKLMYKYAFKNLSYILFQNNDDLNLFIKLHIVKKEQSIIVPGSGVDINRFKPAPLPSLESKPFVFLLVCRLLKDKGVIEYVKAAQIVRNKFSNVKFQILGDTDISNPSAIPKETVEIWHQTGIIEYLGKTDDVVPYLTNCHCVVLPSYREGTPRSLLEASAISRPIIATDVPGCRNVVVDGETGFLCTPRSPTSLAEKMLNMLELTFDQLSWLGQQGRKRIESEFDEQIVIKRYLDIIRSL